MKPKQEIIPQHVIKIAKVLQEADRKKQCVLIMQKRACGKQWANKLARENLN